MSWITTSDPLALVAINAGQVGTPSFEAAAAGSESLDTDQRSIVIGEPVPIAFCRRRDGFGGILVSPGASECRFENDTDNDVTAYYLLVVSEGQLPGVQVRDVFQGLCRVGSISQTYNRRAGTWTPENAIVEREGFTKPEASYYCGSKGAYPGMTTVSFQVTIPNGFDVWKKQVHFFLRGGMQVTRLVDATFGPSDNFCDLAKWMLLNSGRFPASLIDDDQLEDAADFLEVNSFTCNCWITESSNYLDFLAEWAPLFLLCESNRAGKRGLRPILPVTAGNEIDTGAITPVFTFTEDNITTGSVEIQYTSLAERRPFVVQVIWRQQLEDDFGIIRTAEVRFGGTATDGPYESHDLSEFCTRENHAVKVGAHILARRVYTTHTIRFTARPQSNNLLVTQGDIIRVRLTRQTSGGGTSYHDYLYQVQRITKTLSGELSYECVHFPVDTEGRSLIALAVAGTGGTGITLSSNRSGLGCDLNSSTDETIPEETFSLPDFDINAGLPVDVGGGLDFGGGGFGGGGGDTPVEPNPDDGLDDPTFQPHTRTEPSQPPVTGNGLDPDVGVCGANGAKSLTWFRNGTKIISFEYISGNANITYENPTEPRPAFLSAFDSGILAIGTGDAGNIYTSVVECNDGRVSGRETFVEEGFIQRNYRFRYYLSQSDGLLGPGWIDANPLFVSYNSPPKLELDPVEGGSVYIYDTNGSEQLAVRNPYLTQVQAIVI
jgi:hypothetical protein